MDEIITEKNYPVQRLLVFKSILGLLPVLILVVASIFYLRYRFGGHTPELYFLFGLIVVLALTNIVITTLRRATFHYSIDGQFLNLRQGIISKQQRHIPYGVIQNILVKQDLFDRIFGLASLTVENASQGAGAFVTVIRRGQLKPEALGFFGNGVSIPGLIKENAEILKGIILQKMKENPIEDSQSGL